MSKYRNIRTTVNGHTFDSKKEAARYQELCLLSRAKKIRNLVLQPEIKIEIKGVKIKYDSGRQLTYRGDFRYYDVDARREIVEDVKGYKTRTYTIKKALVKAMGIEIVET